jgi:hypothetical protein
LQSVDLDGAFRSIDPGTPDSLVGFLNKAQAFVIVPEAPGVLYAYGEFISPNIGVGKNFDRRRFPIGNALFDDPNLGNTLSEKGDQDALRATPDGWNAATVFGWFDSQLEQLLENPSIVVCDDMGKETADFIALDRNGRRVVLIHCKGSDVPHIYGASQLHVVCSQAVKNCGTLNPFNPAKPPNCKRWHEPWHSPAVLGTVSSRVRRGRPRRVDDRLGDRLWERIDLCLRDPNVEREVWMVLGSTLSKDALLSELRKEAPAPEAIQATHLLNSTLASVAASNAKLRILCSP